MPRNSTGPKSASSKKRRPAELPVLDQGVVHERADAARNRILVLGAAERLFKEHGVAGVTMDDVAAEAGVGKGTLYRRFGDKGGLAVALLNERERELQESILSGPPPLGPGAPPAERLTAFVTAYLTLVSEQLDLVLLSETSTPGARLNTGAHAFWRQHLVYVLELAQAPDPDVRADLILAGVAAEQVRHWLQHRNLRLEVLSAAVSSAALALTSKR
jgi:AcrR family transcriptional regulator